MRSLGPGREPVQPATAHHGPVSRLGWVALETQQVAAQAHNQGGAPSLIEVLVDGAGPRGGVDGSFADSYVPGDIKTDIPRRATGAQSPVSVHEIDASA
jgi:hypothetical protein